MSWEKRETTEGVGIGDGENQRKEAGGLLAAIKTVEGHDSSFLVYEFVQQDGETLGVFGSASIDSRLGNVDIGKFIKLTFEGWGVSKNNRKFKQIDVAVWDEEKDGLLEVMKTWPRLQEIRGNVSKAAMVEALDNPPDALTKDDESDLPF